MTATEFVKNYPINICRVFKTGSNPFLVTLCSPFLKNYPIYAESAVEADHLMQFPEDTAKSAVWVQGQKSTQQQSVCSCRFFVGVHLMVLIDFLT